MLGPVAQEHRPSSRGGGRVNHSRWWRLGPALPQGWRTWPVIPHIHFLDVVAAEEPVEGLIEGAGKCRVVFIIRGRIAMSLIC